MKKKGKIILGIGAAIGAGLGIYALVKEFLKETGELEKQENQAKEGLAKAGISETKLNEEISDEDNDFAKLLYVATRFNPKFDIDLFDLDNMCDDSFDGTIHVLQSVDDRGRRKLNFVCRFGDYVYKTYRWAKFSDFNGTLRTAATHMGENIVKFSEAPRFRTCCFVRYSRINPLDPEGERLVDTEIINPKVYAHLAKNGHDGINEFYIEERKNFLNSEYRDYKPTWIQDVTNLREEDDVVIEDIFLASIITFPIRSNKPRELYGIDVKTATECLEYLINDVVVHRENSPKNEYKFKHIVFNKFDENSNGLKFNQYYDTDEDDNILIDRFYSILGEDDDE